jgi:putative resolvase
LGVTTQTLRDWTNKGKLKEVRTEGNQRRIPVSEINRLTGSSQVQREIVLVYTRCSTQKQTENLERQVGRLLEYASTHKLKTELFKDIGSGLNENRKSFKKLLKRLADPDVHSVLIEYKDRICRYGFETFKSYCNILGVEVITLCDTEPKEFEQEFAEDVIALVTSFSARLYGRRGGRKTKKKGE